MSTPLILVAASGLAREAASAAGAAGSFHVVGVLDDDPSKSGGTVSGAPVLGPVEAVTEHPDVALLICAGKGASRRAITTRLAALGVTAGRYATVIDPSARVPEGCVVGAGSILLANTVLTADVKIGRHVVCMPNVTLTHDDILDDFATLTAGVSLAGGVHVGEAAYIGMNASVREKRRVGAEAILGMGSVLLADQPAGTIWAGVPARDLTRQKEPK